MFPSFFTTDKVSKDHFAKFDDSNELLTLQDVHIAHGDKTLLSIDAITIPNHKLVAFVGPNGAGKSTLLHTILDQHTGSGLTTSGQITIQGRSI